jgi:hypothetical protein
MVQLLRDDALGLAPHCIPRQFMARRIVPRKMLFHQPQFSAFFVVHGTH